MNMSTFKLIPVTFFNFSQKSKSGNKILVQPGRVMFLTLRCESLLHTR